MASPENILLESFQSMREEQHKEGDGKYHSYGEKR